MHYVGIDWADVEPQSFVILTHQGNGIKDQGKFERSVEGLGNFIEHLQQLSPDPSQIAIGIDHKGGLTTSTLMAEGYQVYAINPKSADRARDIYRPAGGKDDKTDAFVHAKMVQAGCGGAKPLRPRSSVDKQLSELLRLRRNLVKNRTQQKQMLGSILSRIAPALRTLCGAFQTQWVRAMLQRFPLHQDLCEVHGNTLNAFFAKHRMQKKTEQKIRRVRKQKPVIYNNQQANTHRLQVRSLLRSICAIDEQIEALNERIEELGNQHRDQQIYQSLPNDSEVTLAGLCSAFGPRRQDAPRWRQYASFFGLCPVTNQSGDRREVRKRLAYDRVLYQSFINLADSSKNRKDCWASSYYQNKRNEGKGHHHALRCLAHKWVKILHAMWRNRTPYDEEFHRNNRRKHQMQNS